MSVIAETSHEPMQYSSGYTLDLYCDQWNGAPDETHGYSGYSGQFAGETFGHCARQARKLGWIIRPYTRTATCPKCAKRKKT